MELLINFCQGKADQALLHMQQAMQEYEGAPDGEWLEWSLEWELCAHHFLSLTEEALEAI